MLDPVPDESVIISILNAFVAEFRADAVISVRPAPEAMPALPRQGEKLCFLDLHVISTSGTHYIVEMQSRLQSGFDERALFYLCRTHGMQLDNAPNHSNVKWYTMTIALQIVDYDSNRIRGQKPDRQGNVDTAPARIKGKPMLPHQIVKQYVVQEITIGQRIDSIQLYQVELERRKAKLLFPPKAELQCFNGG